MTTQEKKKKNAEWGFRWAAKRMRQRMELLLALPLLLLLLLLLPSLLAVRHNY